jgi:hypothetical protein
MKRLYRTISGTPPVSGGGGGGGGGGTAGLLFEPDYTNESNPVSTGIESPPNQGWVSGITWNSKQPPAFRGVAQVARFAILSGSDVPGAGDPQQPTIAGVPACLHTQIQSTHTSNDFLIPVLRAQAITDKSLLMRLSDVQISASGVRDNGLAYPGCSPVPGGAGLTANTGDSMTNQANVGGQPEEHVRVNNTITSTTTDVVYTGPTINTGDTVVGPKHSSVYTGAPIVNGNTYACVEIPVARAQESTARTISVGDCFQVCCGDVNHEAGFSSRAEVYGRFSPSSGSAPPLTWPDPVGSIRWYRLAYYMPTSMDTMSGQGYFDCTQFKGQNGGSPPMAIGVSWGNSNGHGNWILDRQGLGLSPITITPVQLGQWITFVVGVYNDCRTAAKGTQGWVTIYVNPVGSDPTQWAAPAVGPQQIMQTQDVWSTINFTGDLTNNSNQITNVTSTRPDQFDIIGCAAGGITLGSIVQSRTSGTITLSTPATATAVGAALTARQADPKYLKMGIYRSISWTVTHDSHSMVKVGGTAADAAAW